MPRVVLAFGSFIVGACVSFFALPGSYRSTLAQGQAPGVAYQTNGQPVVPPISMHVGFTRISRMSQPLDGLECTECRFEDATLTYAGGAYSLRNCSFAGTTRVILFGGGDKYTRYSAAPICNSFRRAPAKAARSEQANGKNGKGQTYSYSKFAESVWLEVTAFFLSPFAPTHF